MAILNHGSTIRTTDGGQTTTTIVTAANIGSYAVASNATYFIGTTQNVFNRASGAQTLTGVSIDGNAATVTNGVYTSGTQTIGGDKTFSSVLNLSTGGSSARMFTFYSNLTNTDDWTNSPISVRERDLVAAAQSSNIYSPNINFHWASRISNSLWMDANGNLAWGSYDASGVPSSDGAFYANNLYASIYYDKNDSSFYVDPANESRLNYLRLTSNTAIYFTTTGAAEFNNEANSTSVAFRMIKSGSSNADGNNYGVLNLQRTNHTNAATNAGASIFFELKDSSAVIREYAGISGCKTEAGAAGGRLIFHRYGRTELGFWDADQLFGNSSVRSPIFYDSANTAYYLDAASTSSFNALNLASTLAINGGDGIRVFKSPASSVTSQIYWANGANTIAYNWQIDENNNAAMWGYGGTAWAKLLTVTSGGGVGIGTSTISQKLNISGNIMVAPVSSSWAEGLSFTMPTASTWGGLRWRREVANADGNHYIGYTGLDSTDDLVFGSNNGGTQINNNIRITKAGLVGIGTAPSQKFHVSGIGYSDTDFRAPIFYDSSDTTYYLDPANTTLSLKTRSSIVINNASAPSNLAMLNIGYSGSGETRAIDIQGGWSGGENKSITFTHASSSTNIVAQINAQHNSPGSRLRWGKLYHGGDSSAYTMELISESTTSAYLSVVGSVRTPIFYDSDNTSFYIDAASTSVLNTLMFTSEITLSKHNARNLLVKGAGGADSGILGRGSSDQFAFQLYGSGSGSYGFLDGAWAGWDIRKVVDGDLFLNDNNTYYLNPGSTTNLNNLTVAGTMTFGTLAYTTASRRSKNSSNVNIETVTGLVSPSGPTFIEIRGFCPPTMFRTTQDRPAPYGLGFGNGSESGGIMPIGAGDNLQEIMLYGANSGPTTFTFKRQIWEANTQDPDNSNYYGSAVFSINTGTGAVTASTDIRSPIFYDSNDTNYYLNPASSSVLNTLTMAGTITGALDATVSFTGGVCTAASYNYILNGANDTGNKLVIFVNGSTRTADGGVNALTIRNDGGAFILGSASYLTSILGSSVTINGNAALTSASTLTAGNLSGTIPSGVLGNSTVNIGTTAIALNRGSGSQTLTGISIDGNAGTATTLQTARTINGTSFNGSANITTSSWGTSRTLTIGSTGKSVDGSAAVSWSLAEIGALPLSGGQITGNTTFSADNHLTFGPNSTWGSSIRIGGNGYTATGTEMASVVTTDGNLHLDAAKSTNGIYLNWYGGTSGVFFGNGSSGQVAFVSNTGNASFSGVVDATQFRDASNTAFYVDPASTSVINALSVTVINDLNAAADVWHTSSEGKNRFYFANNGTTYYGTGNNYVFRNNSDIGVVTIDSVGNLRTSTSGDNYASFSLHVGGTGFATADFRSPIFYDSGNTAYYCDPASNSRVSQISTDVGTAIYLGNQNVSTSSRIIINWHSDADYNYLIGKRAGAWTQPMDIAFYTGIRYHAHQSYNGHIFYVTGYDSGEAFSIGKGDGHVRVVNNLFAPIIYDSNDTGYYIDPASISNFATLSLAGTLQFGGNINWNHGVTTELGRKTIGFNIWQGGKKLNADEDFNSGTNNITVYNNNGGSALTITRTAVATAPNSSGQVLRVAYTPGSSGTSPGFGGFYFATQTAANKVFVTRFVANIPTGRSLAFHSNAYGTNSNAYWLSNNVGTGKWEEYVFVVMCGNTGTFSSTNFFAVSGGADTAFSWDIASATVFDITNKYETVSRAITADLFVSSPIFYDQNNTAYFIDAASTSNLVGLTVANTITGSISGNSGTATTLQTARNINGTSFNGSAAITTATWGTSRTLTIGSTGKSVDGSANISWSLAEIGAAATNQTMFIGTTSVAINRTSASLALTGVSIDGSSGSCTGNAATATNLSTDRTNWSGNGTISAVVGQLCWKNYGNGHTIFDASAGTSPAGGAISNANPDVAWTGTYPTLMGWNGVNTYGVRVDSCRNADQLLNARNINGTSFNGTANITTASWGTARSITIGATIRSVDGSANASWSLADITGSQTNNVFLASPNGTTGNPTFRAIVAADIPTLNQNTTGTAANVTGTVAIANGGTGATSAANARTNLGATTVGANLFTLANPSAITFIRLNADNTVSTLDAATFRTAIGAGVGSVTSVGGTGTVSGLTLSGTVTSSGNLTLGGTLSVTASNFASQTANTFLAAPNGTAGVPTFRTIVAADIPTLNQNTTGTAANVTGTVAVANGGTGATTAANAATNLGLGTGNTPKFVNVFGERTSVTASASTTVNTQFNVTELTMSASITTLTLSNIQANNIVHMWTIVTLGNGTAYSITWPAAVKWPGGTAPTITSANTKRDIYQFVTYDGGTNIYAIIVGQNL